MIYLLPLLILPLVIFGCKRAKHEVVTYSTKEKAGKSIETPSLLPLTPVRPQPPPPVSDTTTKKVSGSSSAGQSTDRKTPTSRGRQPKSKSSNRRRAPLLACREQWQSPSDRKARTPSPESAKAPRDARKAAQTPTRTPARTPATLGSKMSRKSRKASQPRSPSYREYQTKALKKTPVMQSKIDRTKATVSAKQESMVKSAQTALSEYVFAESKHQTLGNVDDMIAENDEEELLLRMLATDQSLTALTPTDPARTPFFDGEFSVWIANRVGSQVEDC